MMKSTLRIGWTFPRFQIQRTSLSDSGHGRCLAWPLMLFPPPAMAGESDQQPLAGNVAEPHDAFDDAQDWLDGLFVLAAAGFGIVDPQLGLRGEAPGLRDSPRGFGWWRGPEIIRPIATSGSMPRAFRASSGLAAWQGDSENAEKQKLEPFHRLRFR